MVTWQARADDPRNRLLAGQTKMSLNVTWGWITTGQPIRKSPPTIKIATVLPMNLENRLNKGPYSLGEFSKFGGDKTNLVRTGPNWLVKNMNRPLAVRLFSENQWSYHPSTQVLKMTRGVKKSFLSSFIWILWCVYTYLSLIYTTSSIFCLMIMSIL